MKWSKVIEDNWDAITAAMQKAAHDVGESDGESILRVELNEDGTVNVYIPPDNSNVFHDIINESKYTLKQGDKALLYLVGGRTYNSFIIAKVKN